MAVPVVENKKRKTEDTGGGGGKKSASSVASKSGKGPAFASKYSSGGSQYKFGVLAKIVRHMKSRHMDGMDHPLSLEEILDETNQLDVSGATKMWLATEALANNPKLEMTLEHTYIFRPPYKIVNKKELIKLLKRKDLNGEGGIMYDDVVESLPNAEKIVQNLTTNGKVIQISRPCDKKRVLFYFDHMSDLEIDGEFVKQWRSISVDGLDIQKIEDYLDKQGIRSMQDQGLKRLPMAKRKKAQANRKKKAPKDNEHLADVLEDYDERGKKV
jgi:transcription initiation factor TFIIE subunit beta